MKNDYLKKIADIALKMFLLVLISIIIGFILLLVVYSIPIDKILAHVKDSIDVYDEHLITQWAGWTRYTHLSNTTDSTIINEAICRAYDSTIKNALLNPRFAYPDFSEFNSSVGSLVSYVNEIKGFSIEIFPRYWHGYLIFFIPVLFVSTIGSLRVILMMMFFLLSAVLIYELGKINKVYIYIYSVVALFINPITATLSFHNTTIYLLSLVYLLVIAKYNDELSKNNRYILLFVSNAILVAYFDFFTYPLVSWGLPLCLKIILSKKNYRENLVDVVILSLSWIFGYVFMWAGKWVLASILTDVNVVADGFNQSIYRISGDNYSYLDTLTNIFESCNDLPMILLFIFAIIIVLLITYKENNKPKLNFSSTKDILPYLLIGLGPFVWYFVIRNHSYIHPWFEYRELAVTLFALLVSLYKLLEKTN